jgi:hypothetical protein
LAAPGGGPFAPGAGAPHDHEMRRGCDAADLPDYPDADLIGCGLDLDATTSTGDAGVGFTIEVAGDISPDYQYRIGFDTDANGGIDKSVKWDNGSIGGGPLDVDASLNEAGDALSITVPLADVVTTCPDDPTSQCVIWQIETQGGIQGGAGLGFLDQARDELTVTKIPPPS